MVMFEVSLMKAKFNINSTQKKYDIYLVLILLGITGGIKGAFSTGDSMLAFGFILAGLAAVYLCRVKRNEELRDERIEHIYHMTSWATLQFSMLFFAFSGMVLISMAEMYPQYGTLGFHFLYMSCGTLTLYAIFHMYFCKKYGV